MRWLSCVVALGACAPRPLESLPDASVTTLAEFSDDTALRAMGDWRALPVFGVGRTVQQASEDRGTGDTVLPLLEHGNRDLNNFICASADANHPGSELVPIVLDEAECADNDVRGFVMARFAGSGRLTRFFFTAFSLRELGPPDDEIVRVYIDDRHEPIIERPLAEFLDGSGGEELAPPFGAGVASHIAWRYPVVFSSRLVITLDNLGALDLYYHQTMVKLDGEPRVRHGGAARSKLRDDAIALLARTRDGPIAPARVLSEGPRVVPARGELTTSIVGPATVHSIQVGFETADLAALSNLRIAIRWEGGSGADVDLPLLELFGAGLDVGVPSSLALASTNGALELRLPMPFASAADITFTNLGDAPASFTFRIAGDDGVPSAPWGHLHVERNETLGPTTERTHRIAQVTGHGRLVGACAMLEGHELPEAGFLASGLNFLESDERIFVDGALRVSGTGTEDWFDSAFYVAEGAFGRPYAQAWGVHEDESVSPKRGTASACRWYVLGDAIDFSSSLDFDIEAGPGDPSVVDRFRTLAYFYR